MDNKLVLFFLKLGDNIPFHFIYCMFKKSRPIFISYSQYKIGHVVVSDFNAAFGTKIGHNIVDSLIFADIVSVQEVVTHFI